MEKQYEIENLMLEITRRCNMTCNHCMRGDAQNIDMPYEVIDEILKNVRRIYTITFTGGEPFLKLDTINYFIDECERLGVEVSNFYIATNGTVQTKDMFMTIARLYAFCDDNSASCISGSNDGYHLDEWDVDWSMYEAFAFFTKRNKHPYEKRSLINQGRAEGLRDTVSPSFEPLTIEWENDIRGTFYVNVNGEVMTCCDLSYDNQEQHIIGNVNNFEEIEIERETEE